MTSQWLSGDGSLLDLLTKPGAGRQRGNRKICSCLDFGSRVGDDMEYGIMDGQAHCGDYAIASLRSNNFHLSIKTCYSWSLVGGSQGLQPLLLAVGEAGCVEGGSEIENIGLHSRRIMYTLHTEHEHCVHFVMETQKIQKGRWSVCRVWQQRCVCRRTICKLCTEAAAGAGEL